MGVTQRDYLFAVNQPEIAIIKSQRLLLFLY